MFLADIMSQNELHTLAQHDTPDAVSVPNSWPGLAMWAAGRFGVGVLFAGIFGWWLMTVYGDLRKDADRVLTAFERQATTNSETTHALKQLTIAVERIVSIQKEVDRNSADINTLKRTRTEPKPQ